MAARARARSYNVNLMRENNELSADTDQVSPNELEKIWVRVSCLKQYQENDR